MLGREEIAVGFWVAGQGGKERGNSREMRGIGVFALRATVWPDN